MECDSRSVAEDHQVELSEALGVGDQLTSQPGSSIGHITSL